MRVAVLDDYASAFARLPAAGRLAGHEVVSFADSVTGAGLAERLDGFDAVILLQQRTAVPRDVVERLTTVRLLSQTGRNTSHLDVAACTERGITVSAGGAGGPNATAELTWALILAALRHVPEEVHRLRSGQWQGSVGTGLHAKTLGVYGLGRIGSLVAEVGRAFGMRVLVWGREGSLARATEAGYAVASSRATFFTESDVLSVHLPLSADTTGIVTSSDLGLMKPDALIVNTSRAAIVAPGALVAALKAGRPGQAAVDVFETEPVLGASDPLLALPNVTATPHLGYVEWDVLARLYDAAVDQVLAYAAGAPVNVVG
ncbi:MAG: D-2-hydroxyacid dehydrogenase family protein [Pedococcus sp.]